MAARQGIIIKRNTNNKSKAKYKLKTQKIVSQIARNGVITTKYAYSKIITRKKYTYK